MTVTGLHVRPTRALRSWRTMPNNPRRRLAAGSDALLVLLQHWMGPVWQEGAGAGGVDPPPVGTAMAAAARAKVVKILNCMLRMRRIGLLELIVSDSED
jgi:hypothetical protein